LVFSFYRISGYPANLLSGTSLQKILKDVFIMEIGRQVCLLCP